MIYKTPLQTEVITLQEAIKLATNATTNHFKDLGNVLVKENENSFREAPVNLCIAETESAGILFHLYWREIHTELMNCYGICAVEIANCE